jgi:hypothetical protein
MPAAVPGRNVDHAGPKARSTIRSKSLVKGSKLVSNMKLASGDTMGSSLSPRLIHLLITRNL